MRLRSIDKLCSLLPRARKSCAHVQLPFALSLFLVCFFFPFLLFSFLFFSFLFFSPFVLRSFLFGLRSSLFLSCYYRRRCIRLFVFVPSIFRHVHARETYPHDRRDSHCTRCIFIVPRSHGPGISTGIWCRWPISRLPIVPSRTLINRIGKILSEFFVNTWLNDDWRINIVVALPRHVDTGKIKKVKNERRGISKENKELNDEKEACLSQVLYCVVRKYASL